MSTVERVIDTTKTYGKQDFMERAGWSVHAFRTAKRNGLRVIVAGGRAFIRGIDFDSYLDNLAKRKAEKIGNAGA